jgi:predicted NBD/HSP70 family sugar kinase
LKFVKHAYCVAINKIGERYVNRIQGIGVAMPSHIWQWSEEVNAPQNALAEWEHFDLQNALSAQYPLPVFILNDAAAACNAELSFGNTARHKNFLYVFVGTFLGGGVVINNSLIKGKSGNAGAIGSLPLLDNATTGQLMSKGSLYVLSQMLKDNNENPDHIYDDVNLWSCSEEVLSKWCSQTAVSIAFAAHCATCLLDIDGVVIDGAVPASVKLQIVEATQQAMLKQDTRGTTPAHFSSGVVGAKAQSIGSASFPLSANYF